MAEGSNFAECDDSLAQCLPAFLRGGTSAALAARHQTDRLGEAERLLADGERNAVDEDDEPLRRSINSAIAHILDSEQWNRLRFDYLGDEEENR